MGVLGVLASVRHGPLSVRSLKMSAGGERQCGIEFRGILVLVAVVLVVLALVAVVVAALVLVVVVVVADKQERPAR